MQIFDFTNGTKGKAVGEAPCVNLTDGCHVTKNGKTFSVKLSSGTSKSFFNKKRGTDTTITTSWCSAAGREDARGVEQILTWLDPKDYGCEAILFCWGCATSNYGRDEEWIWYVLGTTEWNRNALKQGILTAKRIK
jgi:hypothetical protein